MKIFKKSFFLSSLIAILFASFSTVTYAQTHPGVYNQSDIVFNSNSEDDWAAIAIPVLMEFSDSSNKPNAAIAIPAFLRFAGANNGYSVLATHKKTGTQIIAVIRDGKIAVIGMVSPRGSFKVLEANANPCFRPLCTSFQLVHCYTLPWGECICICGSWYSSGN